MPRRWAATDDVRADYQCHSDTEDGLYLVDCLEVATLGESAGSPIVKDEDQFQAVLGLVYRF